MPNTPLKYFRLQPDSPLPPIHELPPFKAIIVIESEVPQIWLWEVSRWLALSACGCVMAWGQECGAWSESVEEAKLEAFNYDDVPEDDLILATSHDDEDLSDVFWFSKHRAHHPAHDMRTTVILHIATEDKKDALESLFEEA